MGSFYILTHNLHVSFIILGKGGGLSAGTKQQIIRNSLLGSKPKKPAVPIEIIHLTASPS